MSAESISPRIRWAAPLAAVVLAAAGCSGGTYTPGTEAGTFTL